AACRRRRRSSACRASRCGTTPSGRSPSPRAPTGSSAGIRRRSRPPSVRCWLTRPRRGAPSSGTARPPSASPTRSSAEGRADRPAAFVRDGVQVDVHWGLHVSLVAPGRLRPLNVAMWRGATETDGGWWEPSLSALAAYLALHTADRLAHEGKRSLLEAVVRET